MRIGLTPFIDPNSVKNYSYDSLLAEVNLLMVPKRTFSCFVVDILKYCGVELPLVYTSMGINKEVHVYGLEAIQAHNGWAMAITGAVIVMIGLSILSFIISQLHRIIALVDGRNNRNSKKKAEKGPALIPESKLQRPPLSDLGETMKQFQPLTLEIGNPFDLTALFQVFVQHDDPHPHLTIRSLREQGYLIPDGSGLFTWKHI